MDAAIRETLGDLTQKDALSLCVRLWREPVWDLKIVAGRILALKSPAIGGSEERPSDDEQ